MKHFNQVLAEAQRSLRKDGDLPLTAIGFDAQGRGFKIWMQVEKDQDKERFSMAIAGTMMVHSAIEYYVVFTGWMVLLDKVCMTSKRRLTVVKSVITATLVRCWSM